MKEATPAPDVSIVARYHGRRAEREVERQAVAARSLRMGWLRAIAFIAAVVLLALAYDGARPLRFPLLAASVGAAVAFLLFVRHHRSLRRRERWLAALVALNDEGIARLARNWDALPAGPGAGDLRVHPYALDLDIVGPTSLERLLSTVSTAAGARTLRAWLLQRAEPAEALDRQQAMAALAEHVEFRQGLAATARLAGLPSADQLDAFLKWAESPSWLAGRRGLLWTARLLPLVTLSLMAAQMAGATSHAWWLLGIVAATALSARYQAQIGRILEPASAREGAVGAYSAPLRFLRELPRETPRLARIHEAIAGAWLEIRRLERWVSVADVRYNGMMNLPLQLLFLWDVHVLERLEHWREAAGRQVRPWLDALGEAEALAALATLRADHPDWSLPELVDGAASVADPDGAAGEADVGDGGRAADLFVAEALGHPLLPPGSCVRNDVQVGPPGTFLLVTGSNMSGKSTLLRAIGVNAVLAQAGGPVSARRLRLPRLAVHTSMRVQDSLAEGISQFMAQLNRVADAVRAADAVDVAGPGVLYLLDEPLQGTNEAERREALRIVLRRLLDSAAIGAIATHDLRLHRTERLEKAARTVHLAGSVTEDGDGAPRLVFDYRLRPGPATSTNALDLLRLVGIAGGSPPPQS